MKIVYTELINVWKLTINKFYCSYTIAAVLKINLCYYNLLQEIFSYQIPYKKMEEKKIKKS